MQNHTGSAVFDELPGAHDREMDGQLRRHWQAVRNKKIGQVKFLLELLQQEQHLGTHKSQRLARGNL